MPERRASLIAAAARLPAATLIVALRSYQRVVSPVLPVFFGSACGCRFSPTCSAYAVAAVQRHGALAGAALALWRLLKCTPLHPGGPDPVPAILFRRPAPRCARSRPMSHPSRNAHSCG